MKDLDDPIALLGNVRLPVDLDSILDQVDDDELSDAGKSDEWLTASLTYRRPVDEANRRYEAVYSGDPPSWREADVDYRFSAAVATFGLSLRESEFRGNASLNLAKELATGSLGDDDDGVRADFIELIKRAEELQQQQQPADAAPDRQP